MDPYFRHDESRVRPIFNHDGSGVMIHEAPWMFLRAKHLDFCHPPRSGPGAQSREIVDQGGGAISRPSSAALSLAPSLDAHGCYVISLSLLTRWLAEKATALGVEIYSGFAVQGQWRTYAPQGGRNPLSHSSLHVKPSRDQRPCTYVSVENNLLTSHNPVWFKLFLVSWSQFSSQKVLRAVKCHI